MKLCLLCASVWEHRYQLGMITNTDTITKKNTRIENKYKYRVVCSCVWERRCKPDMISGSTAACHSAQGGIASISSTLGFFKFFYYYYFFWQSYFSLFFPVFSYMPISNYFWDTWRYVDEIYYDPKIQSWNHYACLEIWQGVNINLKSIWQMKSIRMPPWVAR